MLSSQEYCVLQNQTIVVQNSIMTDVPSPGVSRPTLADRLAEGKALRTRATRSSHSQWKPTPDRPDPVDMLESSSRGRVPELVPIRYGRMLASPFSYLRGSASAMAFDLARAPATGLHLQVCGDCHIMNFGCFGTPERNFVFDLTDFDETLVGPWEWDVKRLAASVISAARSIGISEVRCKDAARACLRSYRERMRDFASMSTLELWYTRINGKKILELMSQTGSDPGMFRAIRRKNGPAFEKLTEVVDGRRRFRDVLPLVFHPPRGDRFEQQMHHFLRHYRETLPDERRPLLSRYRLVDVAMKVVGVGSVGSRCAIVLLMAGEEDALILQYKEADRSVLEPYVGKSKYHNNGQRVVCGQRLLQSASDLFLGWASDDEGRHFYFRQLRDMKTSIRLDGMTASDLTEYVELCGYALARGHAKAGDPALLSGYLGQNDAFDRAVTDFACAYADQMERDHAVMVRAVKEGRLIAETESRR